MGMSTHVIGFRPPDDKWKKMKAVYDACKEADTDPPEEVERFFNDQPPDPAGVEVRLRDTPCCKEYNDGVSQWGYEIDLSKLPKDVTVIRVFNSC